MDDNQLKSFVKAVELGSFNKAAKEQFLTVPSFVQRISSLERDLGYPLFNRSPRGVTPTPEGLKFYKYATQALSLFSNAKKDLDRLSEDRVSINIGIWWKTPPYIFKTIEEFSLSHPAIAINLIETNWNTFANDLVNKKIDLFFSFNSFRIKNLDLCFEEYGEAFFYCVFSPQSKLADSDKILPEKLSEYIIYAGADWSDIPELTPAMRNFFSQDNVVKESIFTEKLLSDCLQDRAVSIFSQREPASPTLHLDAKPLPWPGLPAGVSFRKNPSPLLREFITLCKINLSKVPKSLARKD